MRIFESIIVRVSFQQRSDRVRSTCRAGVGLPISTMRERSWVSKKDNGRVKKEDKRNLFIVLNWRLWLRSTIIPFEYGFGITFMIGENSIWVDACGYRIRPFAIFQTLQHFGTAYLEPSIAGECYALTNRVVKFDGWHTATDRRSGVRARLDT